MQDAFKQKFGTSNLKINMKQPDFLIVYFSSDIISAPEI